MLRQYFTPTGSLLYSFALRLIDYINGDSLCQTMGDIMCEWGIEDFTRNRKVLNSSFYHGIHNYTTVRI